ncbi:hypothetical protein NQ176_g1545 [Zarea fungicola]|uniref:Uncharacterized protein n=1 Tax=Zarea fungicola TaxID=93591 RepID=A0ACC1NTG1_9HYPO|nr:hypothetical protein NQ176_g1545 [Lecanicillium fungicola]
MKSTILLFAISAAAAVATVRRGTGIGAGILPDNGSLDGVLRNDRTPNNNQETEPDFAGLIPEVKWCA